MAHWAIDGYNSDIVALIAGCGAMEESTDWQHFGCLGHVPYIKRASGSQCPNVPSSRESCNAMASKTRQMAEQTWLLARNEQTQTVILHARHVPSQNGQVFAEHIASNPVLTELGSRAREFVARRQPRKWRELETLSERANPLKCLDPSLAVLLAGVRRGGRSSQGRTAS